MSAQPATAAILTYGPQGTQQAATAVLLSYSPPPAAARRVVATFGAPWGQAAPQAVETRAAANHHGPRAQPPLAAVRPPPATAKRPALGRGPPARRRRPRPLGSVRGPPGVVCRGRVGARAGVRPASHRPLGRVRQPPRAAGAPRVGHAPPRRCRALDSVDALQPPARCGLGRCHPTRRPTD